MAPTMTDADVHASTTVSTTGSLLHRVPIAASPRSHAVPRLGQALLAGKDPYHNADVLSPTNVCRPSEPP